jgi:outer membrane protein insertion porin family
MRPWTVLALLLTVALPARAQDAFVGQPIVDVRVETADGAPVPVSVLELVETRIGEPLSMERVRDTIDHLVGLGRYDDVRVTVAPSTQTAGVVLRWLLTPVQLIGRVTIEGGGDLSAAAVRGVVDERFGGAWPASRAPELAAEVGAFYRDRGYRAAQVVPIVTPGVGGAGAVVTLRVEAGPRTRVASATVVGTPTEPQFRILQRLQVEPGRPYDRQDLQRRLLEYEADLREDGHYEASVRETTTFDETGRGAAVEVMVDAGPRVRVIYAGDPVPEGQLETLVPVQAERSVDEDLLEDASRNIEAYLRERGYRDAQAPYARSERGGELVLTFTVDRGPLHRVAVVDLVGNQAIPRADIEPLLKLTRGDPFVDARAGAIAAAIEELYRVRGHERARVTAAIEVLPEAIDASQPYRPVDTRFTVFEGSPTLTGRVEIVGGEALPEADLRGVLGLVEGRPFYRPLLAADRDQLENLFRNRGYLAAQVTPTLDLADDGSRADVTWSIRAGEQSRVDRVLITGNDRTSTEMIRRELGIDSGDPLSSEAIGDAQRRLSQLGLYRRVRIVDLPRTGSPRRDLLVTVEEAPSTTITYGGGLEVGRRPRAGDDGGAVERVEVAPRGFLEVSRRNLWGKNRTLTAFSRVSLRPRDPAVDSTDPTDTGGYGLNDYRITGAFREPRAFGTPVMPRSRRSSSRAFAPASPSTGAACAPITRAASAPASPSPAATPPTTPGCPTSRSTRTIAC